jgi:predicted HicB family RNase H-like nuclease
LKIATAGYFESLKKAGKRRPVLDKIRPFSGQLRLRMPRSLHAELSQAAENDGVSLNTYLISLLVMEHTKRDVSQKSRRLERTPAVAQKRANSY